MSGFYSKEKNRNLLNKNKNYIRKMKKIINYHEDDYQKKRHPEFLNSPELSDAWSAFVYIEYFNGIIDKDILEFGGAMGYNLIQLSKFNQVMMIEPSPIGRKTASSLGIKSYTNIEEMKKTEGNHLFDIILCRHVLEHVHDPLTILKDIKSLLKSDGFLILVLPYEKQLKPVKEEIDFHLFCWTPRIAINLLNVAGFNNTTWKYNYFTGKRLFYPIYKNIGAKIYRFCLKITGRILNAKEMVFIAYNSSL
jgi:SAM-dependent methyltransferase